MKSVNRVLVVVSLIFAFFIFTGQAVVVGNVVAAPNNNFSIMPADNTVNSSAWILKYSASENGFKIFMSENNGEKEYTVRSKFFEVVYILNRNGFGARMVKGNKAQVPAQILEKILNRDALKNQKVISGASTSHETALNLIASYLPDLINDNYKYLLQ
jgi:hypothetical protein